MAGTEVGRARADELAAVGRLTVAAYTDGFVDADDPYVDRLADTAGRAAGAELWVARADGEVLGSVTYCPAGSAYREIAREGEGEFRMLAVAAAARGRGVARLLVERCVERTREEGCTGLRISTMATMHDAHRLYERLGFTRSPADDWSPVPGVRLLAYALELAR
ncbi:Acetyltransferase (GNAT) family protein [Nocardioides scoriae]|uniref:Acetyltransferase (GNAT) family protein n=1 Tax=Nocardioides scoriae TaxID=642780 RepID=A0A1H1XVJ0_9ACTN|nr:GNAT family N-acetyltransferase [Nocardioides scoriae]SDT13051.1 Acetyltransferase (GNAT) family protein [Nocardioides scoriae]